MCVEALVKSAIRHMQVLVHRIRQAGSVHLCEDGLGYICCQIQ